MGKQFDYEDDPEFTTIEDIIAHLKDMGVDVDKFVPEEQRSRVYDFANRVYKPEKPPGRKAIFKTAMTNAERQKRYRHRQRRIMELLRMKKTAFEQVAEFHESFGHPIVSKPKVPNPARTRLRMLLIVEEALEVLKAIKLEKGPSRISIATEKMAEALNHIRHAEDSEFGELDLTNLAKELADLEYVTCGAALEFGVDLDRVMQEVHRSNMSKLGSDGRPLYNDVGKVIKGPNYQEADIESVLYGKKRK